MGKTVAVKKHRRATPSSPPHECLGRKPGPKPVSVKKLTKLVLRDVVFYTFL